MLSSNTLQILQQVWEQGEQHDQQTPVHHDKWRNITPDTGRFLYQLLRASSARRILEIGTSNGYSTMWLGLAAGQGQGHVSSLDISADKQQQALSNLRLINVENQVSLLHGDAGDWLRALEASPIDFLFLDADRGQYVDWWPSIQRVLRPGGLVVMDNALSHVAECAPFVGLVLATPGYLAETYPIGKGQFVILKDE